ncbi:MAG: hypothetical protein ABSB69_00415 [Solirubrobacteraceae bacterium]
MSIRKRPIDPQLRRRAVSVLSAGALAIAPGLLLPSPAPATQHRLTVQSSDVTPAAPGEASVAPPGESTGQPAPNSERRAGRSGRCQLQIEVAPSPLTAGESATAVGSLTCPSPGDASEQTVTIYQRSTGTPGFGVAGTTTTEASGAFRFTTEPLLANSTFYARTQGARSERRAVKVTALVTISGPPESTQLTQLSLAGRRSDASALASNTLTFTGTVSPDDVGGRVVLQRESATDSEDWRRIGLGEVGADGDYSISHTFLRAGTATVRVVVHARGLLPVASEPLTYVIAPRQNPRLTISASAEQLSYGQSVTLSGTATAAANQSLTLLARTAESAFAPVATVTTAGNGSYEFPAQAPLRSTMYKVAGAGTSSTAAFETVKPLLSAQVSSTSVQTGEPLTFSGTITPAHAGQVVYLQRQNPSGLSFHTVDVGTVSAGGAYSIEHTVSGGGTQVFRIKVPGDSGDPAVASEPFKIQVAPAATAPLEPQAPGAGSVVPGES